MPQPHRIRKHLGILLGCLLAALLIPATVAVAATKWGELKRFGEPGKAAGQLAENKETHEELRQYLLGADSTTGDVYVLDEPKKPETTKEKGIEQTKRFFRIQKFNEAGTFLASTSELTITSPKTEHSEEEGEENEVFEGIAVDPKRGRFYVLATEPREAGLEEDREATVASTIYAFETAEKGKELVAAPGTTEGVLSSPTQLGATSVEGSKALIEPTGLTVDPATGDLIVAGHIDESNAAGQDRIFHPSDHYMLERVSSSGTVGERYIDKTNFFKTKAKFELSRPVSPVVAGSSPERVIVEFEGLTQVPSEFAKATTESKPPTQLFQRNEAELIEEPEPDVHGGSLSAAADGSVFGAVSILNFDETAPSLVSGVFHRSATGGEIGWTGGQSIAAKNSDKCVLRPGAEELPTIVAAGKGESVFALAPEFLRPRKEGFEPEVRKAIVEFGPSGTGCPEASVTEMLLKVGGELLPESVPVKAGTPVVLENPIKQADALSVEWTFDNETTKTETHETSLAEQFQEARLAHVFETCGKYLVTEKILTDDLATPEIEKHRKVTVEACAEPPVVTKQPAEVKALAGSSAVFESEASNKPTVQWEVSTNGGSTWSNVLGATSTKLTIKETTPEENGNEYRAFFKNTGGEVRSNPAKLTVTTKAPELTASPTSAEVTAGEGVHFSAAATGAPPPKIQWEVSTNGGGTWSPISGATTETYAIGSTTTGENGYEYRATFRNVAGEVTSAVATLTVKAPPVGCGACGGGGGGEVKGFVEETPIASIASFSTVSPAGAFTFKVTCGPKVTECKDTATVKTAKAVIAKAKPAVLTLASASFTVGGGSVKTVTLHLSSKGRKLLKRVHSLKVRLTILARNPQGASHTTVSVITLHAAKKH
jgi:hypothetical protein